MLQKQPCFYTVLPFCLNLVEKNVNISSIVVLLYNCARRRRAATVGWCVLTKNIYHNSGGAAGCAGAATTAQQCSPVRCCSPTKEPPIYTSSIYTHVPPVRIFFFFCGAAPYLVHIVPVFISTQKQSSFEICVFVQLDS